jgi:hypothetical protein
MVLGFYNAPGLLTVTALEMGMDPGSPRLRIVAAALRNYVGHLVLGAPGGIPWITVALVCGAIIATSHHLAVRRHLETVFWSAIALIGVLEPVLHFAPFLAWLPFSGYDFNWSGRVIALAEFGLAILTFYFAGRGSVNPPTMSSMSRR